MYVKSGRPGGRTAARQAVVPIIRLDRAPRLRSRIERPQARALLLARGRPSPSRSSPREATFVASARGSPAGEVAIARAPRTTGLPVWDGPGDEGHGQASCRWHPSGEPDQRRTIVESIANCQAHSPRKGLRRRVTAHRSRLALIFWPQPVTAIHQGRRFDKTADVITMERSKSFPTFRLPHLDSSPV